MKGSLLKRGLAALAAFAVGLGGLALGVGSANAVAPQLGTSITLTGSDNQLANSTKFRVLKIASFTANEDGTVTVTTVDDVLETVKSVEPVKTSYTGAATAYGDPIRWLSTQNEAAWRTFADGLAITTVATSATVKTGAYKSSADANRSDKKATLQFTGLEAGLYLLTDANGSVAGVTQSLPILVGTKIGTTGSDVLTHATGEVEVKNTPIPLEKTIVENNKDVDEATKGVGDTVSYKITSQIPDTSKFTSPDENGNKYMFKFTDTLSKGQAYQAGTLTVKVGTQTLTKGTNYTTTPTINSDGKAQQTITIDMSDYVYTAGKSKDTGQGEIITITYDAKLTADATSGSTGNQNKVQLEYSNNPNKITDHGTVDDKTKVYTYDFEFTKVDGNNDPLAGATFTIYTDAKYTTPVQRDGKALTATSTLVDGKAVVKFAGLDEGTYYVKETGVLSGYQDLGVKFKVEIKQNADKSATITFTNETAGLGSSLVQISNDKAVLVVKNITNITQLPVTGGTGIAMFSVIGLLIAGVAVTVELRARATKRQLLA
ncbi:SpaH/EbpB family LPXTG-anchored major pilin [Bifidobacterium avesanii]|uniref:SpaH/EbpB family LPXTG-anchored major pilin n=1 Tax=Bifidobacterium avesanii TaxID=1798157 RepID=A0A7K3TIZ0_9BIFI|nr:SpaH/EbpB family LPXTG-anchored major pilin [Bifidobacterium avesanii]KAB8291988.1 peptidase [Bifidobacterium avesanii]NEG78649.1 SpaH/EbpB family LPXTG-anchored major pilin [Bifidobacterium avesanii]